MGTTKVSNVPCGEKRNTSFAVGTLVPEVLTFSGYLRGNARIVTLCALIHFLTFSYLKAQILYFDIEYMGN
jgi:hypothetical protein